MHYTGIDIIEIQRIEETLAKFGERFLKRIYTDSELKLSKDKAESLAARFAGKEAVMKALGTGTRGVGWREIEILSEPSGKPVVNLYDNALSKALSLGMGALAISLSHSREYAVATVVAEGSEKQ